MLSILKDTILSTDREFKFADDDSLAAGPSKEVVLNINGVVVAGGLSLAGTIFSTEIASTKSVEFELAQVFGCKEALEDIRITDMDKESSTSLFRSKFSALLELNFDDNFSAGFEDERGLAVSGVVEM
jgi:hypothetical protein